MEQKKVITVSTTVNAPIQKVWDYWTKPEHITKWNSASPDWHTPTSTNDLRVGRKFTSRMEARDGSMGFDFWGIYDIVDEHKKIEYTLGDDRKVSIAFSTDDNTTTVTESFEAEATNPIEMQQGGWQALQKAANAAFFLCIILSSYLANTFFNRSVTLAAGSLRIFCSSNPIL
jgi:uncharacterized protein YndB with AHSA1/START domain